MTGNEAAIPGWYTTFQAFGQRQDHSLLKTRTEAIAGLAYNNQQIADRCPYGYNAFSIGIEFWAPPMFDMEAVDEVEPERYWNAAAFWISDLASACGLEFRIGQDVILAEKCFGLPPGYGAFGDGLAWGVNPTTTTNANLFQGPQMYFWGTQGQPTISNRFMFESVVEIPRGATIEAKVLLSEYARELLAAMGGPHQLYIPTMPETVSDFFYSRYGITVSLYGIREVQQRGQLEAR